MKKNIIISIILFIGIIIIIQVNNPIILKWVLGSAKCIGKPIKVEVYVNGQLNEKIKVFHIDKYWNNKLADYYIINSAEFYNDIGFISVNKTEKYVGFPNSTNKRDYDVIFGFLFQSKVGSKFVPIEDEIKGLNFNPNLEIQKNEIILNLPSSDKKSKKDNLRLVFNN